jgi:hypothetical protein
LIGVVRRCSTASAHPVLTHDEAQSSLDRLDPGTSVVLGELIRVRAARDEKKSEGMTRIR